MANTELNVSAGKPAITGAIWWAPKGSTLPTDADTALDAAFKCLGYVSEDGLTNSNSKESNAIRAWGGDTVLMLDSNQTDTFAYTLLEVLNIEVLKSVYGPDNVSGTLATGLTVRVNTNEIPAAAYVVELALRDGAIKRIVAPNAKLTTLGDIVYKDNNPVGYPVTLTAQSGGFGSSDNDTHKEYILKA